MTKIYIIWKYFQSLYTSVEIIKIKYKNKMLPKNNKEKYKAKKISERLYTKPKNTYVNRLTIDKNGNGAHRYFHFRISQIGARTFRFARHFKEVYAEYFI